MRSKHKTLYKSRYSNPVAYFKYIDGKSTKTNYEIILYEVCNIYHKADKRFLFFKNG